MAEQDNYTLSYSRFGVNAHRGIASAASGGA
jgi:hypothetical protein